MRTRTKAKLGFDKIVKIKTKHLKKANGYYQNLKWTQSKGN